MLSMTNLRPVSLDFEGPVTALKFHNGKLYCGSGPFLKVLLGKQSSQKIFQCNKIHGISTFGQELVCFGGRSFAVGPAFQEMTVQDWIIDIKEHGNELYILTAHNKVISYPSLQVYEYDQSILYSGSLHVHDGRILVAAGTVLHGVVVWDLLTQKLVYNFTAHSGSIFNVVFGTLAGKDVVASCSDDRRIIVWDLTGAIHSELWGHTSRIWKLLFHGEHLYSVSEDLSLRVWNSKGCVDVLTGHSGRNVWALDVADFGGKPLVVTGGQDGRVKLWQKFLLERADTAETSSDPYKGFCALDKLFVYTTAGGRVYVNGNLLDTDVGNYSLVRAVGARVAIVSKLGFVLWVSADASVQRTEIPLSGHFSFCGAISDSQLLLQGLPSDPIVVVGGLETNEYPSLDQAVTAAHLADKLYVGTRTGALATLEAGAWSQTRPFGRDALTAITSSEYLVVASRSGTYGFFDERRLIYTNKLQRGGIEGLQYQANKDLLAYGFSKEFFTVTNLTHEYQVASENCGGGHRTWSFTVDSGNESCYELTYVKAGALHRCAMKGEALSHSPIALKGTHGREIRGIEFHPSVKGLVATASEDTTVQLGVLQGANEVAPRVDVSATFRRHATPPQAVHWNEDGSMLATAGAKEELLFWKLEKTQFLTGAGALPATTASDLRIMDFCWWGDDTMCCVYSDSTIRIWSLKNLTVLRSAKYSDKCLLHVHAAGDDLVVVATDGQVMLYSADLALKSTHRSHQSGVRASCVYERDGTWYHVSGGEDQSLVSLRLGNEFERVFYVENAHAATICDVGVSENYIYSTGPDQKVCQWTLDGKLISSHRSPVSDAGCLAVQDRSLLVAGVGIGIYALEEEPPL